MLDDRLDVQMSLVVKSTYWWIFIKNLCEITKSNPYNIDRNTSQKYCDIWICRPVLAIMKSF